MRFCHIMLTNVQNTRFTLIHALIAALFILIIHSFALPVINIIRRPSITSISPMALRTFAPLSRPFDDHADTIKLEKASFRTSPGNTSCIIVGCHSPKTPGASHFWNFYSKSGYVTTLATFASVTHNGAWAHSQWCRVPTVLRELRRVPTARILYLDIDTLVDLRRWCDNRGLGVHAPIVMNSLFRPNEHVGKDFVIHGTMVQTNAFVVAPGAMGVAAMKRWESSYYRGEYNDQGAIHVLERDLCGVPGWIACFKNPRQQFCHCMGIASREKKDSCIKDLFEGKKRNCILGRRVK